VISHLETWFSSEKLLFDHSPISPGELNYLWQRISSSILSSPLKDNCSDFILFLRTHAYKPWNVFSWYMRWNSVNKIQLKNSIYTRPVDKFWIYVSYISQLRRHSTHEPNNWTSISQTVGVRSWTRSSSSKTCLGDAVVVQDIYFDSSIVIFFSKMPENCVSLY